jgi:hypothetical protein
LAGKSLKRFYRIDDFRLVNAMSRALQKASIHSGSSFWFLDTMSGFEQNQRLTSKSHLFEVLKIISYTTPFYLTLCLGQGTRTELDVCQGR